MSKSEINEPLEDYRRGYRDSLAAARSAGAGSGFVALPIFATGMSRDFAAVLLRKAHGNATGCRRAFVQTRGALGAT